MALAVFAYISMVLFIGITAYKARKLAQLPLHGRMELYPVPGEKGRHEYGGSYYEEAEWWKKPRELSKGTELKEMLKEMLFIKKLFENQRPLWWLSYALHLGIYFLAAWSVLIIAGAFTELAGLPVKAGAAAGTSLWAVLLYYLGIFTGVVGFALAAFGSGALFLRRVFDGTLKKYTTPQEYFNLLLVFAAVVSGLTVWGSDPTFGNARSVMAHVLSLTSFAAGPLLVLHVILVGVMFIYIPLSKMSHYVGKYFTFHKVLWENEPNVAGSEMEHKVKQALGYRPQNAWSAPHVKAAGAPAPEK
ncbi:respiratory nitrate reductase subunit gamma [Paradesulfitobacterium ferrireducens]|uniref:respiratory nitrate reductase subunit gamma n=1 Tax=Paradesulfitobacterium ferrireducens TaxID=2816476 RepID=UPI001A8D01DD|nr:respiratory nitrate reductase subunit gamma [Paradesulfitobacterium ferrireducens]